MSNMYLQGLKELSEGTIAWGVSDIRVALVTSGYSFDETHDHLSNITNELSGGNYNRQQTAGATSILDDAGHRTRCDALDTTFAALELAAGQPTAVIVYLHNANDALATLLSYNVLTTPPVPNGGDYKIVWGATGVFTIGN